jgi:hypothetical protein
MVYGSRLNSWAKTMSAGGQNSSTLSGITSMRLRDSADVVAQLRVQGVYRMFSPTNPTAFRNRAPPGSDYFLQFLHGRKEGCATCVGLPYQPLTTSSAGILAFRS